MRFRVEKSSSRPGFQRPEIATSNSAPKGTEFKNLGQLFFVFSVLFVAESSAPEN